jgi:hypothetical protein
MDCFSVCKIEAGRAVLLSQEDFELIEFPAKLLPKDYGKVKILVNSMGDEETEKEGENSLKMLLKEVEIEFGVSEKEIERIKEEIGKEGFLRIESLGSTAAILTWGDNRPFSKIFDKSIKVETIILTVESEEEGADYYDEFVDFVIKGQRPIQVNDTKCRVNLPIDLKVALIVKSSVGYFRSNTLKLRKMKFDDFSGIFLLTDLTDLTDQPNTDILEFIRDQGGYISRSYNPDHPITAVITDSFESDLFKIGIDNNLPVVSSTWLEALVSTRELPHFEDHLIKRI